MISLAFLTGLVALLAAPGPTNALLLAAGAACGLRAGLRLAGVAVAAYLLAVPLLGGVFGAYLAAHPAIGVAIRILAAAYLLFAAYRLWCCNGIAAPRRLIGARAVFLTTLINPKGLIVAFVLMPTGWQADTGVAFVHLAAVAAIVFLVSLGWSGVGAWLRAGLAPNRSQRLVSRLSAIALAVFGTLLVGTAVAG